MLYLLVDLKNNSYKTSVRMNREKAARENKKLRTAGKFQRWINADIPREARRVVCRQLVEFQNAWNKNHSPAE